MASASAVAELDGREEESRSDLGGDGGGWSDMIYGVIV